MYTVRTSNCIFIVAKFEHLKQISCMNFIYILVTLTSEMLCIQLNKTLMIHCQRLKQICLGPHTS